MSENNQDEVEENKTKEENNEETPREKNKAKIEALLFATNGLTIKEISKRTKIDKKKIDELLEELEMEYLNDSKGVHILKEGDIWKMSVKPEHTPDLKDILPPEMPKSIQKTLAIIASERPVKQSLIVKIRSNKAYNHIKKLEKMGFIATEKQGRTKIIDLTEKFFKYFRVSESELKKKFNSENTENLKA